MNIVQELVSKLHKKRLFSAFLVIATLAISASLCTTFFISDGWLIPFFIGILTAVVSTGFYFFEGWFIKPNEIAIVRFLDRNYVFMEESGSLLVRQPKTIFETWQKEKIQKKIKENRDQIRLPNHQLKRSIWLSAGMILFTVLAGIIYQNLPETNPQNYPESTEKIAPQPSENKIPKIENVEITVYPPEYTELPARTFNLQNISAKEGSRLTWSVSANSETDSVHIHFGDQISQSFDKKNQRFETSVDLRNNQIYQISISNADTTLFTDYRSISAISDSPPQFIIHSPQEQRSTITEQNREVLLDVEMADDYKIIRAAVQATLAKGSGENVRFRERTMTFDTVDGINTVQATGKIRLHADSLDMQPGDELYFYVTATDNRPNPQTGRSETYFVIYEDTSQTEQAPFGAIAVDLMPEYFRSQRQIIIDTETLLEEKSQISDEEFQKRSNTIGQNQALLRLRYGEYLGIENESGGASEETTENHQHEHESEENINEQELARTQSETAENVPHEFMHDHGSAEMNTLYADSPLAFLKESLANMWDSERYLRTYRPETALPYEYQALELLKKVQQANRQYVRKVGYELSPIPVSETRLSGTIDDFSNPGDDADLNFEQSPLVKVEILIREENKENLEQAAGWVQQADISDADRLYLLNRLRRISTEGFTAELKQHLLNRITDIKDIREYDPAPDHLPTLGSLPETEQ